MVADSRVQDNDLSKNLFEVCRSGYSNRFPNPVTQIKEAEVFFDSVQWVVALHDHCSCKEHDPEAAGQCYTAAADRVPTQ